MLTSMALQVAFNGSGGSAVMFNDSSFLFMREDTALRRFDVTLLCCVSQLMAAAASLRAAWQFYLTTPERDLTSRRCHCAEI